MAKVGDSAMLTMAVMTLETTNPRIFVAGFEVDGAGGIFVGVLLDPRADDAMAARDAIQRFEVKVGPVERFEGGIGASGAGIGPATVASLSNCAVSGRFCAKVNAVGVGNFLNGIAAIRCPDCNFLHERFAGGGTVLLFAINADREAAIAGDAAHAGVRTVASEAAGDHAFDESFSLGAVTFRRVQEIPRLKVAGTGFNDAGRREDYFAERDFCSHVIDHDDVHGAEIGLAAAVLAVDAPSEAGYSNKVVIASVDERRQWKSASTTPHGVVNRVGVAGETRDPRGFIGGDLVEGVRQELNVGYRGTTTQRLLANRGAHHLSPLFFAAEGLMPLLGDIAFSPFVAACLLAWSISHSST